MRKAPGHAGSRTLLRSYLEIHPDEAAQAIEEAPASAGAALLASCPARPAAAVVGRLSPDHAAAVLAAGADGAAGRVLERLEPARAAAVLARIEPGRRAALAGSLAPERAAELEDLARYPPGTAGFLMDPTVTAFRPDTRVGVALGRLRRRRGRSIHDVFLTDGEGRLAGAVSIQDLALAPAGTALGDLARGPAPRVGATAEREEIVETMRGGSRESLAVVDWDGHLLGVLRPGALAEVAEQEATADVQTMVGASPEERALSPVWFAVRKRLPWLQINLGTAFLAAAVVGLFEKTIEQVTALAILLPVVAGQSGNSGAQALAVTMRGLVLREIRVRSWPRVLLKELAVGGANGLAVAAVCSAAVWLWSGSPALSAVIGAAMVLSMVVAGVAGAAIPTLLSAFGQDPAQSSSIILTTVTDVAGFFTFLGLAALFSGLL